VPVQPRPEEPKTRTGGRKRRIRNSISVRGDNPVPFVLQACKVFAPHNVGHAVSWFKVGSDRIAAAALPQEPGAQRSVRDQPQNSGKFCELRVLQRPPNRAAHVRRLQRDAHDCDKRNGDSTQNVAWRARSRLLRASDERLLSSYVCDGGRAAQPCGGRAAPIGLGRDEAVCASGNSAVELRVRNPIGTEAAETPVAD